MRTNLPVTQREYSFAEGETLLSTTDTDSRLTYANAAFIRTSGFEVDELMGQPHNIVRHPDMPEEAFADMWRTLKDGQSWAALVKNRRKDGDHYWVRANASAMRRNGKLVGYMSVRTKPDPQEVQAAESLYAKFKAGQAKGLEFHRGLIVRTGIMRFTSMLQLLPTHWRLRLPILIAFAVIMATLYMYHGSMAELLAVGTATAVMLLLTDIFLENQITLPLYKIARLAQQVASGEVCDDLKLNRVDSIGTISRSINQAGLNVQSLVSDVGEQVSGLSRGSEEIATASRELSARTEQAASSLEETAASMEQQTAAVRQNSDNAQQAAELAKKVNLTANQGGDAVSNAVARMTMISDSSRKIADIIGVIDSIAFQTNILALNAAVEAARAGEQGRGFAVVATEVRALAGRSASAAKEIKALIDESVEKVSSGSEQVNIAGSTITEVVNQVQMVAQLINEITTASKEQTQGIVQVGQAVNNLDEMTQENASMVSQSSSAADILKAKVQRLTHALSVFSS